MISARVRVSCLALLAVAVSSCASGSKKEDVPEYPPVESAELGSMLNVSVSQGVWFGGVPAANDLDLAKRRGIERVIDLCTSDEPADADLPGSCAHLGLEWIDVGLRSDDQIPDAAVDLVVGLLGPPAETKTLMFCGDGTRSATFFAIHRVANEGLTLDEALLEARRAGMQPGAPEEFVRAQVARLAETRATP